MLSWKILPKFKHNLLSLSHCHSVTKVKLKQRDKAYQTHFSSLDFFVFREIILKLKNKLFRFRDLTVTRSENQPISQFYSSILSTSLELPECLHFAAINFGRFGNILALSFELV